MRATYNILLLFWLLSGLSSLTLADDPGGSQELKRVDFVGEILPILRRSCFECHGDRKQEGGLRLDNESSVADSGIVDRDADEVSELIRRVTLDRHDAEVMPAIGDPLPGGDIEKLRRWVAQGAEWPDDFRMPEHWAYVPPQRPVVGRADDWAKTPIDVFVLERLQAVGLKPSRRATPERLVRRVFLDLVGLPPSPAEVDAFLADPSDQGLERLVDDLLQRPQFGERWARPWLDLARYADSHGFQRDDWRQIWAYRDWVIRALNSDMPFDQFTIEQLAGDLLPNPTEAQKTATGFHRCTPTNVEAGSLPEETRIEQVIDRVNTTAAVWLGTTLECAQCHDHKYDPFSMEEYYRLLAFFNSTELEADRRNPKVPSSIAFSGPYLSLSNPKRAQQRAALQKKLAALKEQEASSTPGESGNLPASEVDNQDPISQARKELERQVEQLAPDRTLVMRELDKPRLSTVFERGDYRSPGPTVTPGTPAVLHGLPAGPPNRLTLARWLVATDNPLTARVTVNRWWAELFGQGIVPTVEDFGLKGGEPSHPELLDWLAVEYMESGWSLKRLLRTIVLSATYQQSSRTDSELLAIDDRNVLLARGPRFRLDAEMIRDNALEISGLLDRRQFGPPIQPFQPAGVWSKIGGTAYKYEVSTGGEQHRRGVYVVMKRGAPYPSLVNFDASSRLVCALKRSRTNTPLQALTLLNDPVFVEAAQALAVRILKEKANYPTQERLNFGFRLCTARHPNGTERRILRELFAEQLAASKAAPDEVAELAKEVRLPGGTSAIEFAAWYSVASVLLNMHETITKQ